MTPEVAAIVLAAGRGSRFGDPPKLLAEIGGVPLVRRVVEAALTSRASPAIVVTGHRSGEIEAALAGLPALCVRNADYAEGLSTSLRAGFGALPPWSAAALVCLGDMPDVSSRLMDRIIAGWIAAGRPDALVPTFARRRGNPALLSRTLENPIASLTGDAGAGGFLRTLPDAVEFPVDDKAVTIDLDTPEALERYRARTTPPSTAT